MAAYGVLVHHCRVTKSERKKRPPNDQKTMSKLSRYFRFREPAVSSLRRRILSSAEASLYSVLPEDRGLCVPVCWPDCNDGEVLLTRVLSAPNRARVHESGRINTPEVPASSMFLAKPGHSSNRARGGQARHRSLPHWSPRLGQNKKFDQDKI
jgi:hypothetical protein